MVSIPHKTKIYLDTSVISYLWQEDSPEKMTATNEFWEYIMKTIPNPQISADFTVDDIHKIREWHYEITKDMSPDEHRAFYNDGALEILKELGMEANIITPQANSHCRTASLNAHAKFFP